MELVIKLSKKNYEHIKRLGALWIESERGLSIVSKALLNGTPLPKGHGKLGDLDIILNKAINHCKTYSEAEDSYCRGKLHAYELYAEEVENADTIIEADEEK